MTAYLIDFRGTATLLPMLVGWDVRHATGTPCDSFEVSFVYKKSMLSMLSDATKFKCEFLGDTVFFGVVDEFEIKADGNGMLAVVRGRGLAALLLDNEAEAAEYYNASLQFILDRHVYPCGINLVKTAPISSASLFSVASGDSCWKVLDSFVRFCGGVVPRFSRDGILLLNGEKGVRRKIDSKTAVSAQIYTERRYGVISSALVKNKAWGISSAVENKEFLARGGNSRRVISVPRKTYYDAMRHTGEYQIERSMDGSKKCELVLAAQFAAFPGDIILLEDSLCGIEGEFTVAETRCWANKSGGGTILTLEV